jgi:two-component system, response regulator PdtaR
MTLRSPVCVLVVEDEFFSRLHAVDVVNDAGFTAIEASNADEAIATLEDRKDIRIVLTDINMPGSMDGLKLAHAIRKRWPPYELPSERQRRGVRISDGDRHNRSGYPAQARDQLAQDAKSP